MSRMPDFIIIGAMKSATSTLQKQLTRQRGIFMTDPKEPNFFSDDDQYVKGIDWYQGLFDRAGAQDLKGEASTHYTKLPRYPHCVERLQSYVSNQKPRLIYVMRNPVDRLISHYIHEWSQGVYKCGIDVAVQNYSELREFGCYAMQLRPYFDAFGQDTVLPVFFDRLTCDPQGELERVCRFIGYKGKVRWDNDYSQDNVSSQRVRKFPLYDLLVDSSIATWVRRTFVPQPLRDQIKVRFSMRDRPTLSEAMQIELEKYFDQDLALLGEWLSIDLNCANFKEVTTNRSLDWSH